VNHKRKFNSKPTTKKVKAEEIWKNYFIFN